MITSDLHHFINYGFKNVRRRFKGISYRDRIHKAILSYFNILGVEMFLARVELVIIDLSSKILLHFPGFLNLSELLVTPSSVCIIFCQGHLENADSFGSSTWTTFINWAVDTRHNLGLHFFEKLWIYSCSIFNKGREETRNLENMTRDRFRVHHQKHVTCGKTKQRVQSLKFASFHNKSPPPTMIRASQGNHCLLSNLYCSIFMSSHMKQCNNFKCSLVNWRRLNSLSPLSIKIIISNCICQFADLNKKQGMYWLVNRRSGKHMTLS